MSSFIERLWNKSIVKEQRLEQKPCLVCAEKESHIIYLQKQNHELTNRLMELIGIYHISPDQVQKIDSVLYPEKDKEVVKKEMLEAKIAEMEIMGH